MSGFVEQLMLAEKAAENIYFARVNCELIESLHKRLRADQNFLSTFPSSGQTQAPDKPVALKESSGD